MSHSAYDKLKKNVHIIFTRVLARDIVIDMCVVKISFLMISGNLRLRERV